jgi:hypothetical protein
MPTFRIQGWSSCGQREWKGIEEPGALVSRCGIQTAHSGVLHFLNVKRWQQLLSCCLAFCVAFAGAVGLSPTLHVQVEHGGHGHAHSHAGFHKGAGIAAEHPREASRSNMRLARLFAEKYPQPKLFGLDLREIYRAVGSRIARALQPREDAPNDPAGDGHAHDSLAQMLLSGAVEGLSDVPPLAGDPTGFMIFTEGYSAVWAASDFEAQTASRAPPRA